MKRLIIFLIIIYGLKIEAIAQADQQVPKDTININEVVITGTTTRVNKNNIPMPGTTIFCGLNFKMGK